MQNGHKSFIDRVKRNLPELASARDLVRFGIYRTEQAAYKARIKGLCPAYFRLPCRGIAYPRQAVLDFLELHAQSPNGVELPIENGLISNSKPVPIVKRKGGNT